jgi:hypothetical protein
MSSSVISISDIKNISIPPKSAEHLDKNNSLWKADTDAEKCHLCKQNFVNGITTGKHHCRNCGNIVCGSCSSKKYNFSGNFFGDRVCDLCYNCVLNTLKTSKECISYLQSKKLKERKNKQYIYKLDDNFYMITPGKNMGLSKQPDTTDKLDTGTIISISLPKDNISLPKDNILLKGMVISSQDESGIKLNVTESSNIGEYDIGSFIILENIPENSDLTTSETNAGIQVKKLVDGEVDGEPKLAYLFLTQDMPLNGGYKYSKRKNKRSVKRRIKKRSNTRRKNKKVTKRLHKSRRRRARR